MEANQNVSQMMGDDRIIIAIAKIKQFPTLESYVLHLDARCVNAEDRPPLIAAWFYSQAICEVALKNGYQM